MPLPQWVEFFSEGPLFFHALYIFKKCLVHNTYLHLINVCVNYECVKIISVNPEHENKYVHSRRMSPHCDQLLVFGTVDFPYQYYMYQRLLSQKSHTYSILLVCITLLRIKESNG